ncbi:MAG: hypothetical protein ABW019_13365 [Chitinophagaceae bacterium]
MIRLLVFIAAMAIASVTVGQSAGYKDSIEVVKAGLGGLRFYQHDKQLKMSQLTSTVRSNPQAFAAIQKAKTNNTLAFITGFIGGALIGYEIGNAVAGKKVNGAVIGVGAGFIGISIPFGIGGVKNTKRAVYLYNAAYR